MPLHLLGKKSWNVYNQDNIERVRHDEAKARIAQKEEERRRRDDDAADRLRLLRGGDDADQETTRAVSTGHKRKRIHDDDDDDDDDKDARDTKRVERRSHGDEHDGPSHHRSRSPNTVTVTDPLDQISNMRFRDAAGRNAHAHAQIPWYSAPKLGPSADADTAAPGRNVWGKEDAGRHVRDQKRLDASDPLLAMKRGVKQLREIEKQKAEWRVGRERDLNEVEEMARRERRKRRKERKRDIDEDRGSRRGVNSDGQKRERHGGSERDDDHGSRRHHHRSRRISD